MPVSSDRYDRRFVSPEFGFLKAIVAFSKHKDRLRKRLEKQFPKGSRVVVSLLTGGQWEVVNATVEGYYTEVDYGLVVSVSEEDAKRMPAYCALRDRPLSFGVAWGMVDLPAEGDSFE